MNKRIEIAQINEHIGDIDIFICASSFETRCLTIPRVIVKSNIDRILICHNIDLKHELQPHTEILCNLFKEKNTSLINFHNDKPIQAVNELLPAISNLKQLKKNQRYLIDITTFTHEGLLLTLRILRSLLTPGDTIKFVYTEAGDYSTTEKEKVEKWLSKGVRDIRSVLGYAGTIVPSKKLHLIIMLGFGTERASSLIDIFQPQVISLGLGDESQSINKDFYEINQMRHEQLTRIYSGIESFKFSCINPEITKINLDAQIEKFKDYNVVIAPMNTKLSTLGAALVAFEKKDVQLIYASANLYNYRGFSIPGSHCYLIEVESFIK